jgi:hypothetical protein
VRLLESIVNNHAYNTIIIATNSPATSRLTLLYQLAGHLNRKPSLGEFRWRMVPTKRPNMWMELAVSVFSDFKAK